MCYNILYHNAYKEETYMKKTIALIMALVMIMSVSVFAAEIGTEDMKGAKKITGAKITYEGTNKGAYAGNTDMLINGTRDNFGAKLKGTIQFVFDTEQKFSGIRSWMSTSCVQGAEGKNSAPNMNGKDHRRAEVLLVKVSNDGKTWTEVANTRNANNQFWFDDYYFGKEITAKYLSLSSQKSNDNWGEWEIGEIAFITDEATARTISNKQGAAAPAAPAKPAAPAQPQTPQASGISATTATSRVGEKIDKSGVTVKASSDGQGGSSVKMLDGNIKSYWHSAYQASGSTITSYDQAPFTLDFTFAKKTEISGISYTPRQDSIGGYWLKTRVMYSTDGKKYQEGCTAVLKYSGNDPSEKIFGFGKNVNVKAVRVIIEESSGYCMAAEVDFFGPIDTSVKSQPIVKTTTTADVTPGSGKIVLKLGSTSANANGTAGTVTAPYIVGGATMLPFKYTIEALGGAYSESGDDITVTYNGATYNFKKNSNYLASNGVRLLLAKPTTTAADGTAMVPVIFFTKTLNLLCEWNQVEQTVVIKK